MRIAAGTLPWSRRSSADTALLGRCDSLDLSAAGGLTQFGAFLQVLHPGARSSDRHWHSAEDEFLYVLEGSPTLVDDAGPQDLAPGDAVCWRAGVANGHHILNRSDDPCRYLIVGTRVARDVCTYPDHRRRQINTDTDWQVVDDAAGTVLRGGPLPSHLLDLPDRWGRTASPPPPPLVRRGTARRVVATPEQIADLGDFANDLLSDTGGLTQFGAFTETLPPGAFSSHRHWHEAEDELLLVLDGTPTLIEDDGPQDLAPGDACAWPAGLANGHQIRNRLDKPCTYLVIGTRRPADTVHYSDIDRLYTRRADGTTLRTRRDGSPLPAAPEPVSEEPSR